MKRIVITVVLASLAVAGCGGINHHGFGGTQRASSVDLKVGTMSGQAFIRQYDTATDKVDAILADDFKLWADGELTGDLALPDSPGSPLTPAQRKAAAAVVMAYAKQLVAKGQLDSSAPSWLKAHGVA